MSTHTSKNLRSQTSKSHTNSFKKSKTADTVDDSHFLVTCNCCKRDLTNDLRVICAVCQEHGMNIQLIRSTI